MTGWLDTNVILRYLLNDHEDHSKRALTLFRRAAHEGQLLPRGSVHRCGTGLRA